MPRGLWTSWLADGARCRRRHALAKDGRDHLGCDPESGHVFLFTNARRNRLKLLVYDHSGLWICSKKLDGGRFGWPTADTSVTKIVLSHEELALLLGGIDLAETQRRKLYRKPLLEESEKLRISA